MQTRLAVLPTSIDLCRCSRKEDVRVSARTCTMLPTAAVIRIAFSPRLLPMILNLRVGTSGACGHPAMPESRRIVKIDAATLAVLRSPHQVG
ncbi:hypothetical protein [Falsirhodobacter sp. 1013]|uniref:hypothetical protein n=1 Tax=Falsirhodobacter sp. 1013 TaxID=3417566 RepID=UPI003EBD12BD